MNIKIQTDKTLSEYLELKKEGMLQVDHEYQRGLTWSTYQKQLFIDSIFRKYPIPAFYFHEVTNNVAGRTNTKIWIVDGQQRIDAIYNYVEGAFPLLDPNESSDFKFPNFIKDEETPWAGKRFDELSDDLQVQFLETKAVTYFIHTNNENKIRDLFIRLQGGVSLTPQDKRDSWPGNFTEFVLTAGGKSDVPKWYGWDLFRELPKNTNEGKRRTLTAQCYMLFQRNRDEHKFSDNKSQALDDYYHANIDFNKKGETAKRFEKICKELHRAFQGHPKKLSGHYIIHLILFLDAIYDEAVPTNWVYIPEALNTFDTRVREAQKAYKEKNDAFEHRSYHDNYGYWTGRQSDIAANIERRHAFFLAKMTKLAKLTFKDSKRVLHDVDKTSVYYRDERRCQVCRMQGHDTTVDFKDAEFHHVIPHSEGGETSLENCATVHKECHPKSSSDTETFKDWWPKRKQSSNLYSDQSRTRTAKSTKLPPNGTQMRYTDPRYPCNAEIIEGKIHMNGHVFTSFSSSAEANFKFHTKRDQSRNGWKWWEVKTPDSDEWIRADLWRSRQN